MKKLPILAVPLLLLSGLLVSCPGSNPNVNEGFQTTLNPMDTPEGRYLKNKAEAGLTWKTRAEEIVRQSKAAGRYEGNEFEIRRAYAKVDTNLQVWANAVTADAKVGRPVAETEEMQNEIESSLKALGEVAGVPGTRGWKRDLVVVLLKSLFPVGAPMVDQVNLVLEEAEAERLRKRFLKAHELTPASQLEPAKPDPVPAPDMTR